MYRIDHNKNVYISRGDDIEFIFPIRYEDGTPYVFKKDDNGELHFYIMKYNSQKYEFLLRKIFSTDGSIICDYDTSLGLEATVQCCSNTLDNNGNIIITLTSEETMALPVGQLVYQVRGKLNDNSTPSKLVTKTLCNRHGFTVIEDDFSNRQW